LQTPAPPKVYSLSQVASSIRKALEKATGNQSWLIRAEILKISEGLGQKTVYVDLVEESEGDQKAKMRGVIWASNGARIIETLGADASQILACGSEVVFSAQIQFHERFGLSLLIESVDLRHMLGEMERRRQSTLSELERIGALVLNKKLSLPWAPQHIALVGSPGTSGFRDFVIKSLFHPSRKRVKIEVFPSVVQGKTAPMALITALRDAEATRPDLIVMVRGGGSKLDLDCFNDLDLCKAISQLETPLWTGIGHESDLVVADLVAHSYWKTPTDVADALIRVLEGCTDEIEAIAKILQKSVHDWLDSRSHELWSFQRSVGWSSRNVLSKKSDEINGMTREIHLQSQMILKGTEHELNSAIRGLRQWPFHHLKRFEFELNHFKRAPFQRVLQRLQHEGEQLTQWNRSIEALHPDQTLLRGFAIVRKDGDFIHSLSNLQPGDTLQLETKDGWADVSFKNFKRKQTKS
jgi:exodeoxyribonuclease VII large subunit